jgi:hypothetical protein
MSYSQLPKAAAPVVVITYKHKILLSSALYTNSYIRQHSDAMLRQLRGLATSQQQCELKLIRGSDSCSATAIDGSECVHYSAAVRHYHVRTVQEEHVT